MKDSSAKQKADLSTGSESAEVKWLTLANPGLPTQLHNRPWKSGAPKCQDVAGP